MFPRLEWLLTGWTGLAATWWATAVVLVARRRAVQGPFANGRMPATASLPSVGGTASPLSPSLSIFKPLPPLRGSSPAVLAAAIETFICQLDDSAELLLGIEEQDGPVWKKVIKAWEQKYPQAQVRYVCQPRPLDLVSPKVSWHRVLSQYAQGEFWLWSDADIVAPATLLTTLRQEQNGGLVTCLYVVRHVEVAPQWLEALFVNVEIFPGVLACERAGAVRFAFGAGLLFRAADFRARVGWEAVSRMAEDCVMGQRLSPVRISTVTVETLAAERHWRDAVRHYLRWQKTVRWNRPGGFAGLLLIMPVWGWILVGSWPGLLATLFLEGVAAGWLCRQAGCRIRRAHLWVLPVWSLLRPLIWLLCWLPIPVVFQSQQRLWWSLKRSTANPTAG